MLRISVALVLGSSLLATTMGCASSSYDPEGIVPEARPYRHPALQEGQEPPPPSQQPPPPPTPVEKERHGIGHRILFWIPNRFFDIFDVVRARLRLGPGIGLGVRATEVLDLTMGTWTTIFIGIHGPRGRPKIPWPFGFESYSGMEFSVADSSDEDSARAPNYGLLEFGAGFQVVIIGVEVGVDFWNFLDFFAGIILLDPAGDDF